MFSPNNIRRNIRAIPWWAVVVCLLSTTATAADDQWTGQVLDGILRPYRSVEVAATQFDRLSELHVVQGQRVEKSQLLAEVCSTETEYELRIARLEADAHGRLDQASAEVTLHEKKVATLAEMVASGAANVLEFHRAEADLRIMRARLQNERENLTVAAVQADRLTAKLNDYAVRAPFAGVVVKTHYEEGEYVSPSSPAIVTLQDVSRLKATFSIDETEISHYRVGQKIRLQLPDNRVVEGRIEFLPPIADADSGWFMVEVSVDNQDGSIIYSRCKRLP